MATGGSCAASVRVGLGPVPFKDVEEDADMSTPTLVSSLPCHTVTGASLRKLCRYQGFWMPEGWAAAAAAIQRRFEPRLDDVIVSSLPKCGTTWLVALTFATMCLPFLEGLFATRREGKLEGLPSPRLMNTHMPLQMIPHAIASPGGGGGCRVIYICREPKDMAVSTWHYFRRAYPELAFSDVVDLLCDGTMLCGPFWDHILGYWRASAASPGSVLFLRYEQLLLDPAENVRRLARFLGLPFSADEEKDGIVCGIVELCSLHTLSAMEPNRTGYVDPRLKLPRQALFRKGMAGDWKNHMTPEMARRVDSIVADRFRTTGLTFQ
ncbi:hypothetical protein BS78_06G037700 [Paspalum vaginatum]|nr:hypothetical protein BS78_06G037700 [Paspalum vaginatum]